MPVFLAQEQFESWLTGEAGAEHLKRAPNDLLQRWPVPKRVNSTKADADYAAVIIERVGVGRRLTRISSSFVRANY